MNNLINIEQRSDLALGCIQTLRKKYPSFNDTQIATTIGMIQSTFNRIANKQTSASLNSTIKLLTSCDQIHKVSDVINSAGKDVVEKLKKNLAHTLDIRMLGGEFASHFARGEYQPILILSLTRAGTTRDEIKDELGKQGINKLETLLQEGIVSEVNGIIKIESEEMVTLSQDLLKDALVNSIKNSYQEEKWGTDENWLSFQAESVDLKLAMPQIREILQKAFKEITEQILYSPKYYGSDKVFIGMVADTLLNMTSKNMEDMQ